MKQEVKKAVILCAGLATRMLPITKSIPKELLPLANKPILQHLLEDCAKANLEEVILIISDNKQAIKDYFGRNIPYEEKLITQEKWKEVELVRSLSSIIPTTYLIQKEPKGTMDALLTAREHLGDEPFLLLFGDEYLSNKESVVEQLLKEYKHNPCNILALQSVPMEEVYKYGIITPSDQKDDRLNIIDMVEKPSIDKAPSNMSYIGPAILTNKIFDAIDNCLDNNDKKDKEYVITDAYVKLAKENNLHGLVIHGDRYDLGSKSGFIKSNVLALLKDEEYKEEMKDFILDLARKLK